MQVDQRSEINNEDWIIIPKIDTKIWLETNEHGITVNVERRMSEIVMNNMRVLKYPRMYLFLSCRVIIIKQPKIPNEEQIRRKMNSASWLKKPSHAILYLA